MLDAKLLKTLILNVNGDSLPGPLIIGTFEKRAPDREIPLKFPSVLLPGFRIGVFW